MFTEKIVVHFFLLITIYVKIVVYLGPTQRTTGINNRFRITKLFYIFLESSKLYFYDNIYISQKLKI